MGKGGTTAKDDDAWQRRAATGTRMPTLQRGDALVRCGTLWPNSHADACMGGGGLRLQRVWDKLRGPTVDVRAVLPRGVHHMPQAAARS